MLTDQKITNFSGERENLIRYEEHGLRGKISLTTRLPFHSPGSCMVFVYSELGIYHSVIEANG